MKPSLKKHLIAMQRYCAFGERCKNDIRRKLENRKVEDKYFETIIAELEKEGFINEKRYASAFCHDKFEFNGWGRLKIRNELLMKNIPEDFIQMGLKRLKEPKYSSKIYDLIDKKSAQIELTSPYEHKAKVARFLYSRGFEPDIFWPLIKEVIK